MNLLPKNHIEVGQTYVLKVNGKYLRKRPHCLPELVELEQANLYVAAVYKKYTVLHDPNNTHQLLDYNDGFGYKRADNFNIGTACFAAIERHNSDGITWYQLALACYTTLDGQYQTLILKPETMETKRNLFEPENDYHIAINGYYCIQIITKDDAYNETLIGELM